MPWKNRIVGTGEVDPEQLLANPNNYRIHPGSQRDVLRDSLNLVGWVATILVNQRTGFVIDGHARIEEALSKHEKTVPVTYVDVTPEEEAIILASFDAITGLAEVDNRRLMDLLRELDIAAIMQPAPALGAFLANMSGETPAGGQSDPDEIPEARADPEVNLGDLFVLGQHRILCGDCTKPENVARLMADAVADIIWTDPDAASARLPRQRTYPRRCGLRRRRHGPSLRGDQRPSSNGLGGSPSYPTPTQAQAAPIRGLLLDAGSRGGRR
jgi:hypothetical protein